MSKHDFSVKARYMLLVKDKGWGETTTWSMNYQTKKLAMERFREGKTDKWVIGMELYKRVNVPKIGPTYVLIDSWKIVPELGPEPTEDDPRKL